jgi:5'-3' exonuclease
MRKTGRHTLIIDGNYFLFRTLYVLPKPSKSGRYLESDKDCNFFMKKLAMDLCYQLRQFEGAVERIVWTIDSKSWRKDFFPQTEYKGNRKQDTTIDWSNFSKITDDFISILNKNGVIISKVNGAEGDDLMYAWNTECLANNKSVILFTGDRDLVQLVGKNTEDTHTILYSPAHKKLYTYEGFSEWLKSSNEPVITDIFTALKTSTSAETQLKQTLTDLIKKKEIAVIEVNPEDFRFKKILTGDSGDNVSPAYWYTKGTRTYGISDNKAEEILQEFKNKHGEISSLYFYNDEYLTDLANMIVRIMNAKHMNRETILGNIKLNVSLMILSSHTIPEGILDEMFKSIEPNLDKFTLNIKSMTKAEKLLENTKYSAEESIEINSSIFKNDESGDDFSFITDRKTNKKIF